MHVQELALLLFDFVKDALAAFDLQSRGRNPFAKILGECLADLIALKVCESDGGVVLLNNGFDKVDGQITLRAFATLVARANEVFVVPAVAFVARVRQTAAASAAAERALEVMLVLAVALARVPVRVQDGLHLIEEVLADQLLVPAGVVLAAIADDAGVVGIGEHLLDSFDVQRTRRVFAVAACKQPTSLQKQRYVGEAVEAGGVGFGRVPLAGGIE